MRENQRDNDTDRYELDRSIQASRRGGRTKSTGSEPIDQNGLPVCVLPKKPLSRMHRNLSREPDRASEEQFHASNSGSLERDRRRLRPANPETRIVSMKAVVSTCRSGARRRIGRYARVLGRRRTYDRIDPRRLDRPAWATKRVQATFALLLENSLDVLFAPKLPALHPLAQAAVPARHLPTTLMSPRREFIAENPRDLLRTCSRPLSTMRTGAR